MIGNATSDASHAASAVPDAQAYAELERHLQREPGDARALVLKARLDMQAQRFQTIGRGASNPVAPNTTEAGRQLNRRTDIKVVLASGN